MANIIIEVTPFVSVFTGLQVSVVGLERALHAYTLEPSDAPFDLKSVPLASQPISDQKPVSVGPTPDAPVAVKQPEKVAASRQDIYAGLLIKIKIWSLIPSKGY